jgi:hypothetical protein
MTGEVQERGETIEECYEFMLAYAAQGLPGDEGGKEGSRIREFLNRAVQALDGLAACFRAVVKQERLEPAEKYHAFLAVLERDANDSRAALELVLAQPVIGSQLIDNLNASIHLRAVLTDMFLVGEILRMHQPAVKQAG